MLKTPSLIETVRVRDGRAPLWHLHLRRLVSSCRTLGIPFPLEFEVPSGGTDRVQRIVVSMKGKQVTEREVGSVEPVRLITAREPHQPYPHKTADRTQFAEASAEAEASGADDALMLTSEGMVAEGTIWAVFWWEGATLVAPGMRLGILPSVARARITEIGPVAERSVPREALNGVPIILANAARGIVPVARLDGKPVPSHPGTALLQRSFWDTVS
ncbi:MAG TPA: aminotransferase class IV [Gemmatimonadales bacterium]|jgi:branched-subunit amino acid aminotransferase/4-amino-4-deoxychorismate lyase